MANHAIGQWVEFIPNDTDATGKVGAIQTDPDTGDAVGYYVTTPNNPDWQLAGDCVAISKPSGFAL